MKANVAVGAVLAERIEGGGGNGGKEEEERMKKAFFFAPPSSIFPEIIFDKATCF